MNWTEIIFSLSLTGFLINLWLYWGIWALMFLPPKQFTVPNLHMGGLGLALPGMIFIVEGQPISTVHHEETHILQMRRYSPAGVGAFLGWHYGTGMLWQKITGQQIDFWSLWEENPLEIEANEKMHTGETPLKIETQALMNLALFTVILLGLTHWLL